VTDYIHERYDKLAFRYVSYVAIPALAIYAVYSLIYETHRGWYSFIISTLTSFVYMFGFVCFESTQDVVGDLT
jgi:Cleft lip and palate transmembrane protein 1 (CLPTM1)